MAKSLVPYLLLAICIIIAWHVLGEFSTLASWLGTAWGIITPFFYGFILAYIINIPYTAIQRLYGKIPLKFVAKIKKPFAIITSYLIFVILIVGVLWFFVPQLVGNIRQFINELPDTIDNAIDFLYAFDSLEFLGVYVNYPTYDIYGMPIEPPEGLHISTADIDAWLRELPETIMQNLNFDNAWSTITSFFGGAFSIAFSAVLILISSIFFLIEKEKISAFLVRMLGAFTPINVYNFIIKYSNKLNFNFKQYIYTQTIDGMILGTLASLVLAFIIQSPFWLILGVMLGIINYIPYFGSIFGSLIAIVVVAFTQGLGSAALAAVILLILQQIDGNVIQPKLMGSSFKLSPLLIIVSVTVGGAVAGVLGMLAAIPIVAVLKDILDNIIVYCEEKKPTKQEEVSEFQE